jgi:glycosyltransferase involved in cell wall biosynthesis
MKVAFVSRWGVQCGIATYTDQLSLALMRAGIEVECIAEQLTPQIAPTEVQAKDVTVTRCWQGNAASYMGAYEALQKSRPNIIHLQHEFGLMPMPKAMIEILPLIKSLKVPIVVTTHTVMTPPDSRGWFFLNFLNHVNAIVAHSDGIKKALLQWQLKPGAVAVIPHGTPENCQRPDQLEARRALYLPDDPNVTIAISLGFITKGKMQHEAIEAIIGLVRDGLIDPNRFLYVVAGEPGQGQKANILYCRKLHKLVDEAKAWNYIRIIPRFIPVSELPIWYGACDFVITGSHQTFWSTSGRAHQEMAFKMASVSADARLLADLNEYRSLKYDSTAQLRAHILRLARDPQLRSTLSRRCGEFAAETSWTNVAAKHQQLYESLIKGTRS